MSYLTKVATLASSAALISLVGVGVAIAGANDRPLNAGRDGIKTDAGGGNGYEGYIVGAPVVTTETVETTTTNTITGEPVVVLTTTETVEIDRVQVGEPEQVGNSRNWKINYLVTYQTTTTTGTETVVTTETILETEVYEVTTTDMADMDPGRAQPVNRAPEGEPADIVTRELVDTTTEVVATTTETIYEETVGDPVETTDEDEVLCNGGVGGNPGANYCLIGPAP